MSDTATPEPSGPLEALIRADGFDELEPTRALNELGRLIDAANDQQHEAGLARAVELADKLRGRMASDASRATLDYYEGNAWAGLDAIRRGTDPWAWERLELEREITCLRRAAQLPRASDMPRELAAAVLTNLANTYSSIGRGVEAIAYWDQALRVLPEFGMALGNRAMAYEQYGRLLENRAHGAIFFKHAHRDIRHLDAHVDTRTPPRPSSECANGSRRACPQSSSQRKRQYPRSHSDGRRTSARTGSGASGSVCS